MHTARSEYVISIYIDTAAGADTIPTLIEPVLTDKEISCTNGIGRGRLICTMPL